MFISATSRRVGSGHRPHKVGKSLVICSNSREVGVWRADRRYLNAKLNCCLYFACRFFPNVAGLRSPKSLPSTSALWVGHTSLMMTPCTHDARNFAGLEHSRTSQLPSLTGSKYGSGFLAAIEDSPVHFAATRPGRFNQSAHPSNGFDGQLDYPKRCVIPGLRLACLVAQEPWPTAGAA